MTGSAIKFTEAELQEIKEAHLSNGDFSQDLWYKLYEYFHPEMPYGTTKARTGDPQNFVCERLDGFLKDHGIEVVVRRNPIWIIIDDGKTFEGHQGHFADCFYSNATKEMISINGTGLCDHADEIIKIREMTDEEVAKYPEALEFEQHLIKEYGKA